jgi:hypothetical protein
MAPLQTWNQIGPSPIISNLSGSSTASYDYGPVVGRVISLAVDPGDSSGNTVYVGGATGGLWKSTNAATLNASNITWSPLLDSQPTLSVGAIAVQPGNSQLLILGTGEPNFSIDSYYSLGFLRSTDAGSTWSLINSANSGAGGFPMDLRGISLSNVVFSSDNPNLVVAGAGASGIGFGDRIETVSDQRFGIFYSSDAGQTWTRATFYNGTNLVAPWSVSSIIYNQPEHLFFATVGFQGIYSSPDGANWYRLASQPGSGLTPANCPGLFSTTCPILRGALTIRPGADEMYVWYVDLDSKDQGLYKTTDGGQSWTALSESGITNCGDVDGCGTDQGFFNLVLSAVPQPNGGTDLYAGAVNLFKCSITSSNPACNAGPFLNLTHVYGCSPVGSLAHVHPDQHALAFPPANPAIVYFGNDGGIYRTLNGSALISGSCGGRVNPFDNLNATMGSMAQFVWLSQDPTNELILLGGTQDNGSPARTTSTQAWPEVNLGDGGYNAINPASTNEWFTAHTDVSIQRCTLGPSCAPANFSTVVNNSIVGGDAGPFYTPYILDPQLPANMLVGTCRLWRGPSGGGAGWVPLSNNLDTHDGSVCSDSSQNQIQSVAAGGPSTSNGSQVIWVGTASGFVWRTLTADSGPSGWSTPYNTPYLTPISSIAIDPKDPTGKTIYFTTLGFVGGQIVLIGSMITGNPTGDLPNIPANSLIFDPEFPNIMYVGTDIGVFQSVNTGSNWTEVGPGSLPSAPVLHLEVFKTSGVKKLRASTYGRGVWETALPTGAIPLASFSNYTVTFPAQPIATTSSPILVTLTNIGAATLNLAGFSLTGSEFQQTNNCSATLPVAASCTLNITFTSSASGNHTGTISLADDAYDSPQVVQLVGNIPTPAINLIDSQVSFPNIAIGATYQQTVVFASSGTGPLSITGISATGDFSETDKCVGTLAINQECTLYVTFRPTASGLRQGSILIADNAAGSPHSIALAGFGVAELVISTDVLQFPNTQVGQTSSPQTITLSNFSSAAIGIKQLSLQGPNTSEFSQTNTCGTSVPLQSSCVVTLLFTPTIATGGWTNFSVIDTNGNTVGALIQGGASDFVLIPNNPSTVSVSVGQTASFSVTVATQGQGSFVGGVSLSCAGGPAGSTCSVSPNVVSLTQQNAGSAVAVSVSAITQAAAPIFGFRRFNTRHFLFLGIGLAFLLISLLLLQLKRSDLSTRISVPKTVSLLIVAGILMLAVSCGGGGGSTPPPPPTSATYSIKVTGTYGSVTNSTSLTLVVNK